MDLSDMTKIELLQKCKSKNKTQLISMILNKIGSPNVNENNLLAKNKQIIIDLFKTNIKDREIIIKNNRHCGSEGQWLEKQMGIKSNSINKPDILGYEMKKYSNKITFGDFSASEYLFTKNKKNIEKLNNWSKDVNIFSRRDFIRYFGTPNPLKNNRYSWSGKCVPVYGKWNSCGQIMKFNDNLDLQIIYSFNKDLRNIKYSYPEVLKKNNIVIAIWEKNKLEKHIDNKFNKNGFFICKKNGDRYEKICFGEPFSYTLFVYNIKNGNIIFDSGMYEGNMRNYSQFRSSASNFWNNLITEEY